MRKLTRLFALMMALTMLLGALPALAEEPANPSGIPYYKVTSDLYDFIDMDGAPIQIEIYSQLANYSGRQTGWGAALMKDLFNVELVIIPDQDGTYQTRTQSGNLGDIVVWGANGEDYKQAIKNGLLLEWDEDDLAETYAPYVWANYQDALASNRLVSEDGDNLYGFGMDVATSRQGHKSFMYSWDLRWDLYSQLGYPEIKNLDDLLAVFKKMKEICPTGDDGKPTYAMSLWPDWDGNYVMYVKAMATAYYGYDEFGFGHYNVTNGEFYDALSDGSPYLTMLKWFNQLYRNGLLDPDSMTQKYDDMIAKVQNGNVFFSIFNYAGSLAYNKEEHYSQNKIMESLEPTEACPIVNGLSSVGGNRVWSIGAKTQYPELCMEIINWLCTPEGRLTMDYGPKELCWDYDENGKTYFTDFGKTCFEDRTTLMPEEWGGATFNDGAFQVNNTTWTAADTNPESGERYDQQYWASTQVEDGRCDAERDWRDLTGCFTAQEYMDKGNYAVDIPTTYSESEKDAALEASWNQVATCLKDYSWRAIYAESDEEYDKLVAEMRGKAKSYGYDKCIDWCIEEAARRNALQAPLR